MDKFVDINSHKEKLRFPIYLVALVDLILFGLLSMNQGIFNQHIMIMGASKILLTYFMYFVIKKVQKGDTYLSLIIAMILSMGLAMQVRLSESVGTKQFIWFLMGMCLFIFISLIYPYFSRKFRSIWLYYGLMIILFIATLVIGSRINGAKNWIVLGKVSIQPSEFIKILFVFFMASFVANPEVLEIRLFGKNISAKWSLMFMVFVIMGFFVLQREFGTALLIFMVYLSMLYVFEKALLFVLMNTAIASAAAYIALKIMPHLQVRVESWLNPFADVAGKGYQITQSLFAIGSGSYFGTGLRLGYPHFIPNVETDFIFSAICEEMGIFGGIALIFLFVLLVYRGIKICLLLRESFTKALAFGLTITLGFQTFLIVGGVTKLIPLTGITLPFVSYGGSSLISSFMILGFLQALSGAVLKGEVLSDEKIHHQ